MAQTNDTRERPLRVAIVGCGFAGNFHLSELIETSANVELHALCDVDSDARDEFYDAAADVDLLTDDFEHATAVSDLPFDDLDGIFVSTPPKYHANQVVEALDNDVHVLVEKPMATTRAGADAIREAYANSDAELWVNYQRRYKPRYRAAKRIIESGEIGEVESISATRVKHSRGVYGDGWRADPDADGGQLFDLGNHMLDAVFWLAGGHPERHAAVLSGREGTEVETYANVIGELTGDVPFDFSLHAYGYPSVENVHVSGLEASLRITKEGTTIHTEDGEREVEVEDEEFLKRPQEILFELIRGNDEIDPDVESWAKLVEFTLDVYDESN